MSRTYSRRYRQPSTPSPVQNLAWWKSPLILGSIIAGIGIIGSTLWIEYTTQRVIHIRADDSSDSAEKYSLERQQHCRASIQQYKPGDIAITTGYSKKSDFLAVEKEERIKQQKAIWVENKTVELENNLKQDLTMISRRFETQIQQCEEDMGEAQQRYNEGYRHWQEKDDEPTSDIA
jgi:hypothetical protein